MLKYKHTIVLSIIFTFVHWRNKDLLFAHHDAAKRLDQLLTVTAENWRYLVMWESFWLFHYENSVLASQNEYILGFAQGLFALMKIFF